jgi:hypothetical protein
VITGPTTPGLQALGVPPLSPPPAPVGALPGVQLPVLELQHMPPVHVSPAMHLFFGWQEHPSEPCVQSVISTAPEAPAGIAQAPPLQMPLAQSGPVVQVVFGSGTVGMHSSPVHVPLWQSLACMQEEPAGEPGITVVLAPPSAGAPPWGAAPPCEAAPLPPVVRAKPPEPPSLEP